MQRQRHIRNSQPTLLQRPPSITSKTIFLQFPSVHSAQLKLIHYSSTSHHGVAWTRSCRSLLPINKTSFSAGRLITSTMASHKAYTPRFGALSCKFSSVTLFLSLSLSISTGSHPSRCYSRRTSRRFCCFALLFPMSSKLRILSLLEAVLSLRSHMAVQLMLV